MNDKKHKKIATVLIVEDEEPLRNILRDELQSCQFATLETDNGKDAVQLVVSHQPDVILLDLDLPVMDGMTALKEIRKKTSKRRIPVIILTNLDATDSQLIEDMVVQSPSYYLVKSDWKIHDIVAKVKEMASA